MVNWFSVRLDRAKVLLMWGHCRFLLVWWWLSGFEWWFYRFWKWFESCFCVFFLVSGDGQVYGCVCRMFENGSYIIVDISFSKFFKAWRFTFFVFWSDPNVISLPPLLQAEDWNIFFTLLLAFCVKLLHLVCLYSSFMFYSLLAILLQFVLYLFLPKPNLQNQFSISLLSPQCKFDIKWCLHLFWKSTPAGKWWK